MRVRVCVYVYMLVGVDSLLPVCACVSVHTGEEEDDDSDDEPIAKLFGKSGGSAGGDSGAGFA